MKCLLYSILLLSASCTGQTGTAVQPAKPQQTKLVKTQGSNQFANIHCIICDHDGNMWFATTGEGLYRYNGQYFTQFTKDDGLSSNTVNCVATDKAGNVWIGTDNGLCRYDGKTIRREMILTGRNAYLPGSIANNNIPAKKNEVWCILQDHKGILWFGTREGLYCYDGQTYSRFLDKPGLQHKDSVQLTMVNCLLEDRDGSMWIGSGMPPGMEGLFHYDGQTLSCTRPGGEGWIRYLQQDKSGNVWIGCRTRGIWRYDGKSFSRFTEGDGLGLAALSDRAGNMWFSGIENNNGYSSEGGLWCYEGGKLKKISDNGLGNYGVWSMAQDKTGNIWLGTRNTGLWRYDGKEFTKYSE